MSAENAPARPIAMLVPTAKARFRPEKYFTTAASVAMLKVSAPMPNSSRPAAMPENAGLQAVSAVPARQIMTVHISMRAVP